MRTWCDTTAWMRGILVGYGGGRTGEMKRCRVAWTEWAMFAKCVLKAESRGVRPAQAFGRAKCRLEQWCNGERESLWNEVVLEDARVRKKSKRAGGISAEHGSRELTN